MWFFEITIVCCCGQNAGWNSLNIVLTSSGQNEWQLKRTKVSQCHTMLWQFKTKSHICQVIKRTFSITYTPLFFLTGWGNSGKNGYGDVHLVRVPFPNSANVWQDSKITKLRKMPLTGSRFCYCYSDRAPKFCQFSDFFKNLEKTLAFSDRVYKSRKATKIPTKISIWQGPLFNLKQHVPSGC